MKDNLINYYVSFCRLVKRNKKTLKPVLGYTILYTLMSSAFVAVGIPVFQFLLFTFAVFVLVCVLMFAIWLIASEADE